MAVGALGGSVVGQTTGTISGHLKGRKEADSKYTMSKKAAAVPATVAKKAGRTFQAKGNFAKDLKGKAEAMLRKTPSQKAKSIAGASAGAAAAGYGSHKAFEAVQKPQSRKGRERSNDKLMKQINKANK